MSEENTIRVRRLPNGDLLQVMPDGSTRAMEKKASDWNRVRDMTEEEVIANALADPDNPPLTDEDFRHMRPIPNPRRIRESLGMTQLEFAEAFEIALDKLQVWEAGASILDLEVITLLRIIEQDPAGARAAIEKSYQPVE